MGKARFLDGIRTARVELEYVLGQRDATTLSTVVVPELSWTAKDVLAHLIGYDLAVLKAVSDVRATGTWTWPWTAPNFDPWNESTVGPRRAWTYEAVRDELDASRVLLLAELEGWPEDKGPFGPATWDPDRSPISWIGPHERDHAEMIAKV